MAASFRRLLSLGSWLLVMLFFCGSLTEDAEDCSHLRLGQYLCKDPEIDEATQEPKNCRDGEAKVDCHPAPNVTCQLSNGTEVQFSGDEVGFQKTISCRNVSGSSYKVAVALSLFLGWLGADRFYLGYPALGLLKFCTVGFCGIGTLIDFVLIAMQIVGPADGSDYIVDYYGARLTRLSITNETYRKPHQSL
ncbi:TM2 domain-containing protein 1 [Cyprinodon tularosa]|uniref:TM2 domain-containing protein 1 n=1 Tax=Cyprinodon tularosa TaxID=77115 RepID=UPI0018E24747|nr:TM2 domain-containing protein 1 [Cyprinodon tularosa]